MYSSYCNDFLDQYQNEQNLSKKTANSIPSELVSKLRQVHVREDTFSRKLILEAVKFKIPDGGSLISTDNDPLEYLKSLIDEINLPFPTIALELDTHFLDEEDPMKFIILAKQIEDEIYVETLMYGKHWNRMSDDGANTISITVNRKTFEHRINLKTTSTIFSNLKGSSERWSKQIALHGLANTLAALACSNIEIADSSDKPSAVKNTLRRNKGKQPFFLFKTLVVNSSKSGKSESKTGNGKHSSPRVHLRRGHIRRLESKNVWVNACVVGDKSNGIVQKDYLVK